MVYDYNQSTHPEIERYRTEKELKTSVPFSKDVKLDQTINMISGQKWKLESYYTQYGNVNEMTEGLNLESGYELSYVKISGLIVYLQNALDTSNPQELGGEFTINGYFTPKEKDIFIAEIFGGRIAIFEIKEVNTKSYFNGLIYDCTFKLKHFLEEEEGQNIYNTIVEKTIDYNVFNEEMLKYGHSPIMQSDIYAIKEDIEYGIKDLKEYYLKTFIDDETKLIRYPSEDRSVYIDTYLIDFIFKTIDSVEYPELSELRRIDHYNDKIKNTVFDMIINRNPSMLYRCEKHLGFKPVKQPNHTSYTKNLISRNIGYYNINYIIDKVEVSDMKIIPKVKDTKFKVNEDAKMVARSDKIRQEAVENKVKANGYFKLDVPEINFGPSLIKPIEPEKEDKVEKPIEPDVKPDPIVPEPELPKEEPVIPDEPLDIPELPSEPTEEPTIEEVENVDENIQTEPVEEPKVEDKEVQTEPIEEKPIEEVKPKVVIPTAGSSITATKQYSLFKNKRS